MNNKDNEFVNRKDVCKRDFSIDLIKAFAVLIIINSHADACFVQYKALATGGAIGDGLFLFCSGYTLFLGKTRSFMNYYKRRIQRIYPSVFAALIALLCLGCFSISDLSLKKIMGGQFVIAIMVYYVILFFIRKIFVKRMLICALITASATLVAYYFFPYKMETGVKGLYGVSTLFRWIPYFGFMLLGAFVGVYKDNILFSLKKDLCKLVICIVSFFAVLLAAKLSYTFAPLQIVSLPMLLGIIFYSYKVCNAPILLALNKKNYIKFAVLFLGSVCLESYLIQNSLITDKLNFIFPFNIPIIYAWILGMSYVVRCLSRFIAQTFKTEDYCFRDVFSI